MSRPALPLDRFLARCRRDPVSNCLIFGDRPDQYGHQWVDGHCVGIHRLALELHVAAKLGMSGRFALPMGSVVRHLPGCTSRACVEPAHLAAGTQAENCADTVAAGRSTRGSRNARTKLSEADVRRIRSAPRTGPARRELAAELAIHEDHVKNVQRGVVWGWLPPESVVV